MKIHTPFIQLNSLLKLLGWVETGADANNVIDTGMVTGNPPPQQNLSWHGGSLRKQAGYHRIILHIQRLLPKNRPILRIIAVTLL
jgi:hypothetical protein